MEMKRIAALLMALCLVFQLVPAPAGAAESPAITVGSAEAYPGNSFYINIEATGLSDLASLDLEIYYDSENLTLSSVTNGSLLSGGLVSVNDETQGVVKLSAAWLSGISGDGRLLRLRFTVNSDAAPGTYRVLAAVGDAHDVNLNPVEISRGTGTVTVQERPTSAGNFNVNLSFADGTTYQQGDTVNVSLVNSSWQSFASGDFKLEYDSKLFSLESVTLRSEMAVEGAVYSVNKDIAGLVKVSYASVQPVSCYNLMDFVLTVIGDTDTETTVKASASDVYTVDLVPYQPGSTSWNLTLEKKTAVPDYPDLYLTDLPTTVGQEGTTLLILEEGSSVAAADFTVKYDPEVYACLEVTAAEGLSETGGMVVINPTFDEGTVKFSYINENGSDAGVELISIQWKCLSSPQTHAEVLTGGTGIVNASFTSVKLDLVPFTGCIFDSFRTEPTCTMDGEEGMMCNACGEKKDVTVLNATGHSYGAAVTPPTCTEQGFTTHTCSVCGDSYVDEYTEATGHSYDDWYTLVEATCTETGTRKHDCRYCDHSETEVTDALGHAYADGICTRCGASDSYLEEGKCGDTLYWRMGEDGTLTIFGTGSMYEFTSSETGPWNAYKDSITKVVVNEGATTIGSNAFRSYNSITDVKLPGTLQALNSSCFFGCEGLISMELVGGLKRIESSAFSSCSNLETVTLPEGLESIGSSAFAYCHKLKGIVIPDSVTTLGDYVFNNCNSLEYANIPEGITKLGSMAFYNCRSLKEIVIPESMETIGDYAFSYCASLTTLSIPAGVTAIQRRAFLNCSALKEIYIYSTDCAIAEEAVFTDSTILLCYEGSTVQSHAEAFGLTYCAAPSGEELGHADTSAVTPPTCTEQGYTTYSCIRCGNVRVSDYTDVVPHAYEDVVTPPTCTEQGYTTYTCPDCGDSYVDDYVDILPHAYKGVVTPPTCTAQGYTTYTCPDCGDTYVDDYVEATGHSFGQWYVAQEPTCTETGTRKRDCENCDHWETEEISALGHAYADGICTRCGAPESYLEEGKCGDTLYWRMGEDGTLTIFGTGAMYDFSSSETGPWNAWKDSIMTVIVKEGAATVGSNAFRSYTSITDVKLPGTLQALNSSCFSGCDGLTSVALTGQLKTIGDSAFYHCSNLESVSLPDGLESIGKQAFSTCGNLKGIVIPDSVSFLGNFVFANCWKLEYANIPEGVTSLGIMAFYACRMLKEIIIPESMVSIGNNAFSSCNSLTSVVIPAGVTSLGEQAFDSCDNLEEMWIYSTDCTCAANSLDAEATVFCYENSTAHAYAVDNGLTYCAAPTGEDLGHVNTSQVTPPTCTAQGYTTHTCTRCGYAVTDSYVDMLPHNFGQWYTTQEPGCLTAGTKRHDCQDCGYSEEGTLDALGHDYVAAVTEPTCTAQGYTTHTCSRCGDSYKDSYTAALGHEYGDWYTVEEAFCTATGTERHDCVRCEHYETRTVDTLGHNYVPTVTAPTCLDQGYTTHTCSRCGDSYVDTYVTALGHDYGEWITDRKPTCTESGSAHRDCSRCDSSETKVLAATGHSYTDTVTAPTCIERGYTTHTCHCGHSYIDSYVDALGHDYGAVVTAPTCLERGYTTYTCSRCADSYVDDYVDATGHSMGSWQVEIPATCTETGQERRTCQNCDYSETRETAVIPHSYATEVTEPDCVKQGYTTYTCTECGHSYVADYTDALGHAWDEGVVTVEPTEETEGERLYTCTRCGETKTEVIPELEHVHSYVPTVTAPTCLDKGYTTYTCRCGDSYVQDYVDALGHDYASVVTAPTCLEQGYTTHTCARCDHRYTDAYVDALGHDYGDWVTDKAATCTEDGSAHRDCSRCADRETKVLDKLGHDYASVVTAPTCLERGYTTHTCSRCGDTYQDAYTAALGHDYVSVVTAPTCLEQGYTTHSCTRCEESFVDSYVAALGHAYGDWVTDKAATCTEEGSAHRNCSRCDSRETEVLEKLGHDYVSTVTAPTCTERGYTTHKCSRCDSSYVDAYVDALGHAYGDWTTDQEPTCTEDGSKSQTCSRCGGRETQILPMTGHGYTAETTAPTCTERGYTTYTCHCGDSYTDNYVDALGHDYSSVVTAPTCTEQGYTTHTCARCGHSYVDAWLEALGHSWDEGVITKAPTEEEPGEMVYTCTVCGATDTKILPELDHTHSYSAVVTAPTCTEKGYTTYTCRCGDSFVDSYVEPLGHAYESVVTAPTCLTGGYTTHTCARCGDTYTDAFTDALGHAWNEGTVTKEPTESAEGEMTYTCIRCGETRKETLPALGHTHSYSTAVTAPTCTEEGYTTYTCACGHSYAGDYVPALGHIWESADCDTCKTCTRCGVAEGDPLGHSWIASDCDSPKTCSRCGATEGSALGHDYADGKCTRCGATDPNYEDPKDPALSGVIRIAGADRIETSLMLADQLKETLGVDKFNAVVVASALNFPDALTGSYLASVKDAPILLTYEAAHGKIQAYIDANLKPGGTVYILGGESAVSAGFELVLRAMGIHTKRVAGADRFGTNLAIMREAGVNASQPVLIATAVNFADSLSASAAGLPMVLVYGSLRQEQKEFLATTSRNFIIIGGEAAVSPALEAELKAIGSVTRVAGSSRYETSVLVAERFVQNPNAVILAYARNFPDGLCGGPLANALGAPLILTDNSGPGEADAYVSGITAGIVVGGGTLISDETARTIFDLAADAVIQPK